MPSTASTSRPAGLAHRGARPLRLRQDHAAAAGRRLPRARRGHDPLRRPGRRRRRALGPAAAAPGRLRARRRARCSRTSTWPPTSASACPGRSAGRDRVAEMLDLVELPARTPAATRTSSPAASSSGSRWPGRSRPTRRSCCSTSRSRRSTPRCAPAPAARWPARCARAGTTAVLVTHDQDEALSLADQVAVMRDGRLVQADAPATSTAPRSTPTWPASSAARRSSRRTVRGGVARARSATSGSPAPAPTARPRCWSGPSRSGSTEPDRAAARPGSRRCSFYGHDAAGAAGPAPRRPGPGGPGRRAGRAGPVGASAGRGRRRVVALPADRPDPLVR